MSSRTLPLLRRCVRPQNRPRESSQPAATVSESGTGRSEENPKWQKLAIATPWLASTNAIPVPSGSRCRWDTSFLPVRRARSRRRTPWLRRPNSLLAGGQLLEASDFVGAVTEKQANDPVPLALWALRGECPGQQINYPGVGGVAIRAIAWEEGRNQNWDRSPASEDFEPRGDGLKSLRVPFAVPDDR